MTYERVKRKSNAGVYFVGMLSIFVGQNAS